MNKNIGAASLYIESKIDLIVEEKIVEEVLNDKEITVCAMLFHGKSCAKIGQLIGLSTGYVWTISKNAVKKVEFHPRMIAHAAEQAEILEAESLRSDRKIIHSDPSTWKGIKIYGLDISTRVFNILFRENYKNIEDLTSDLIGVRRLRGIGEVSWVEILNALDTFFGIKYYKNKYAGPLLD